MKFKALISVSGLVQFHNEPDWVIVDCRFWLEDPDKGYKDYLEAHIPGAVYAHLDEDLSGDVIPGKTGRHPLPEIEKIAKVFGSWGIGENSQVICYDDRGGMIAGRLWWLLQYLGHENTAVLDGGIAAWLENGQDLTDTVPAPTPRIFVPRPRKDMVATDEEILAHFGDPKYMLVDSRAPERFQGEIEPIDPIAGRIPGAINYFWSNNLDSNDHFVAKNILEGRFDILFGDLPANRVTFYCGSGVTAAHNILAMFHAGKGMAKLYAGSWSHWITNPERPIARGE